MENILTKEDKNYLGKVSRYLLSLGMAEGIISIPDVHEGYKLDNLSEDLTYFDNGNRVDIPPGLIPILNKILNYVNENELIEDACDIDMDEISTSQLDIEILSNEREVLIKLIYYYFDTSDSVFFEWIYDEEDDNSSTNEFREIFTSLKELDIDKDEEISLEYNGAGDSGYIESYFSDGQMVPQVIEDWCERILSNEFGSWGDNEGSQGTFIFNMKNKSITLSHSENIEERASKRLGVINF